MEQNSVDQKALSHLCNPVKTETIQKAPTIHV